MKESKGTFGDLAWDKYMDGETILKNVPE